MRLLRAGSILVCILAASLSLSAQSGAAPNGKADISGTWVAKAQSPMGEMEIVYRLKVQDGKITGQQSLPFGDSPIVDGQITGDAFRLTVEVESFGNITRKEITGRIVGDTLVLTPAMPGPPPGGPSGAAGAPPPGGAGAAPQRRRFQIGEVTARRGTPTPSYRAPAVDYATLPKIDLPALHDIPANGLAKKPPMGWNSWNKFRTKIDDATVRGIADAIAANGMKVAGYQYVIIDDGWQNSRAADGSIKPNPNFPDMKALAAYVHSRGLKIGIYSSPGPRTCGGFEGSYGHEVQDAATYAAWGMDYLKYDWCSASRVWKDADMQAAYQKMGEALEATGRPIVYSLCQYGRAEVQSWGSKVGGNLWRTTVDIRDNYASMTTIGFAQSRLAPFAAPGHWNDPDMLEIGNGGMSTDEYRTHLSLWAMAAAPLIAGNDLRSMTPGIREILLNPEVIAIDQDELGAAGQELSAEGSLHIWTRQLSGGEVAVALFNTAAEEQRASLPSQQLHLSGAYTARDLWLHKDLGSLSTILATTVPGHGVVLLKLHK